MPARIVTLHEAALLLNLLEEGATLFDLAGATQLSPTQTRQVLTRLKERGLVAFDQDEWTPTREGESFRNSLAHQFGSSSSPYFVLEESDFPVSIEDETSVDAALSRELNKS
jgi:hypothetical protein